MEITIEFIFAVVTAIITAILGTKFKDGVVPKKYIPIQNIIVGVIASIIAIYFGLFDNIGVAILMSLGMSMGVGGTYDAIQTKRK